MDRPIKVEVKTIWEEFGERKWYQLKLFIWEQGEVQEFWLVKPEDIEEFREDGRFPLDVAMNIKKRLTGKGE